MSKNYECEPSIIPQTPTPTSADRPLWSSGHETVEIDDFTTATHAIAAPEELFALWAITMQNLALKAGHPESQDSSVLKYPKGLILPTNGNPRIRIPMGTDPEVYPILSLPDAVPLNWSSRHSLKTRRRPTPGTEFGNRIVYSLALNEDGQDLVATANIPYRQKAFKLDPRIAYINETEKYVDLKDTLISILVSYREAGSPQPNLSLLPGAQYSNAPQYFKPPPETHNRDRLFMQQPVTAEPEEKPTLDVTLQNKGIGKPGLHIEKTVNLTEVDYTAHELARYEKFNKLEQWLYDTYHNGITTFTAESPPLPQSLHTQWKDFLKTPSAADLSHGFIEDVESIFNRLVYARPEFYGTSVYEEMTPDQLFPLEPDEGHRYYRNDNGELHRDDGPAVMLADGTRIWMRNGKVHRDIGYAVYVPANALGNITDQDIYEFRQAGELCNLTPDHPSVWGSKGNRLWGTVEFPKRASQHLPSRIWGDLVEIWNNAVLVEERLYNRMPESPESFLRSIGLTSFEEQAPFTRLTMQQHIDLWQWKNNPDYAKDRAKRLNGQKAAEDRRGLGDLELTTDSLFDKLEHSK